MTAPTFLPVPRRVVLAVRLTMDSSAWHLLIDNASSGYFPNGRRETRTGRAAALESVSPNAIHPADWPLDGSAGSVRDALYLTARIEAVAALADAKSANPFSADAITRLIAGGR